MSDKKIKKLRYWLAYMLDEMPAGTVFKPGLLHITLLTWFVLEMEENKLVKSFTDEFIRQQPFDVKTGKKTSLGPKEDIPVNLLTGSGIRQLHAKSLEWFERIGARWAVKDPHAGDQYLPHIRRRPGTHLKEGTLLHINSLSLIRATRQEDGRREVAARVIFYEQS